MTVHNGQRLPFFVDSAQSMNRYTGSVGVRAHKRLDEQLIFAVIGTKRPIQSIGSPVGASGVVPKLSVEQLIAVETCPPVAMIVWASG